MPLLPQPTGENTLECIAATKALKSLPLTEITNYLNSCIAADPAHEGQVRCALFQLYMEFDDLESAITEAERITALPNRPTGWVAFTHHMLAFKLIMRGDNVRARRFLLPLFALQPTVENALHIYWSSMPETPLSTDEYFNFAREEWKNHCDRDLQHFLNDVQFMQPAQIEQQVIGELPEVIQELPQPIALSEYHYAPYEILKKLEKPLPKIRVFKVARAVLLYNGQRAAIYDEDGQFFPPASSEILSLNSENPAAKKIERNAAILFDEFAPDNYAHWLLDALPRIYYYRMTVREPISSWIVGSLQRPFHRETLLHFGISGDNIVDASHNRNLEVEGLYCLASPSREAEHPARCGWRPCLDFVRNKILSSLSISSSAAAKRIFISRQDSGPRAISDEEQFYERLARDWGFTRYRLSQLSFEDQVRLFNDAEIVVGAHGAGMANILFCGAGTKIIEIFHPLCGTHAFATIALARELNYYYIAGESISPTPSGLKPNVHRPEFSHQSYQIGEFAQRRIFDLLKTFDQHGEAQI